MDVTFCVNSKVVVCCLTMLCASCVLNGIHKVLKLNEAFHKDFLF